LSILFNRFDYKKGKLFMQGSSYQSKASAFSRVAKAGFNPSGKSSAALAHQHASKASGGREILLKPANVFQYCRLQDARKSPQTYQQVSDLAATGFINPPGIDVEAALPLVSVVIPAYNAEAFIGLTLASVQVQDYPRLEILVVDDGSRDRTADIVSAIAQQDARVRLLQQANAGVAAARNLGIEHARGEFIAPIDADDVWRPDALAKIVAQFQASPANVGVVYAWSVDIDAQDQPTGGFHAATIRGDVYRTLLCHNFLGNASSTLIRRTCLEQVGGYDPLLKARKAQGCEDWDLYLRLAELYEFGVVPEFLVGYRKVASGMSGDFRQMARSQRLMMKSVRRKYPQLPNFLYRLSYSSFYLYLAYQSDALRNANATLSWLKQAVKVAPVFTLVRPGWYVLLLKNLARRFSRAYGLTLSLQNKALCFDSTDDNSFDLENDLGAEGASQQVSPQFSRRAFDSFGSFDSADYQSANFQHSLCPSKPIQPLEAQSSEIQQSSTQQTSWSPQERFASADFSKPEQENVSFAMASETPVSTSHGAIWIKVTVGNVLHRLLEGE
jgi:glycosyltransferase involved in cell wall biosynthesis